MHYWKLNEREMAGSAWGSLKDIRPCTARVPGMENVGAAVQCLGCQGHKAVPGTYLKQFLPFLPFKLVLTL